MVTENLIAFDIDIFKAINSFHNNFTDIFFSNITHFGSFYFLVLIGIVAYLLKNRQSKEFSATFLQAYAVVVTIVELLKYFFDRPRPFEVLENVNVFSSKSDPSFPSGHSAGIFLLASVGAEKFPRYKIPLYALAFLVSISRIFVGLHYPIDVLAGSLIGFFIGKFFFRRFPSDELLKRFEKLR